MTSETTLTTTSDTGRWIRAALVIFPAGTVLLGIASFGIWQWKKDREADRSFKYALALKKEISVGGLEKHETLLRGVLRQPDVMQAVPSYLSSTMGEENMGYAVRRHRYGSAPDEHSIVDGELSGQNMPREVVMVLAQYVGHDSASARALAMMLGIAHEVTGMPRKRTLRFVALPMEEQALNVLAGELRDENERLMHLHVLGKLPPALETILGTKAAGTAVNSIHLPETTMEAASLASSLKQTVLQEAGEP